MLFKRLSGADQAADMPCILLTSASCRHCSFLLNNFLKEHAYRLSQISSRGSNITIHPLRNIMDVSVLGMKPPPPLAATLHFPAAPKAKAMSVSRPETP